MISFRKGKKTKTVKSGSKKEPTDRESSALPLQEKTPKQKGKEGIKYDVLIFKIIYL